LDISEAEKQKFNYYFALKNQINSLEKHYGNNEAEQTEENQPEFNVLREPEYSIMR